MNLKELNVLKLEAEPLLGSGITVLKKASNGKKEYIQCNFVKVFDNGVELDVNNEASSLEERMSYSPKAILEIVESGNEIDRFPLRYVVNAMKKGRNINWDYFEEYKNQNS